MPGIGSLVSALPILRVSHIVAFCLLTRVRNATLGLLRIISTIIGIVARCRVVRRCRLCALSLPIFSTVMTAGVLMACFIYTMLHDSDVSPADYGDAVTAFADGEYPVNVLEAFNAYREDFVSSDREAAAFMMALQSRAMQPVGTVAAEVVEPEPVTAETPEVPPRTEPHEVVATSSAVMVRKVVIPGGKSVRELADVFGAYVHKPRGFRDSKGRRVAYVAFDGTGGVIAYRDYYTDVDTRLEEQIADYLASHNLKLAA